MRTVLRVNTAALEPAQLGPWLDWVRSLGLEPKDFCPELVIMGRGFDYELHLTEYVRDDAGRKILDYALQRAYTRPHIVSLGTERTWP